MSLKVNNLSKTFSEENFKLIDSISFEIPSPSIVAVLGSNGIGKSVSLKIIAGLIDPDSGSVCYDEKPLKDVRFVPANSPIFPWRRAIDDIAIGLEAKGIKKVQRHQMVRDFVQAYNIDLPLERYSFKLSAGQRQLVNVIRALVGQPPQLVILDEPWSALDPSRKSSVFDFIRAYVKKHECIVILTAHSLLDTIELADYVIPLKTQPLQISQENLISTSQSELSSNRAQIIERIESLYT